MLLVKETKSFIEHIIDVVENFVTEELWIQIKSIEHRFALTPFHSRQIPDLPFKFVFATRDIYISCFIYFEFHFLILYIH